MLTTAQAADQTHDIIRQVNQQNGGTDARPVRVYLDQVRASMSHLTREQQDAALLHLVNQGRIVLYRGDDPIALNPSRRAAVFRTRSGEERHIVYLQDRPS